MGMAEKYGWAITFFSLALYISGLLQDETQRLGIRY